MTDGWKVPEWKPGMGCENGWHLSHGNSRLCDCGKAVNPAYRNWFQRILDRRARSRILKQYRR